MSFLYPIGLLGLIGIPILIIIYLIKSKYAEQTVASTYLWTLSEKFLKKRKPIDKVTGIISLILQILAVTIISLAIAHPVIILPDSATEYCFILDASGSMNIKSDNGKTRFDIAKDEIGSIIDEAVDGSVYSLIKVGDDTEIIFEKTESKSQAKTLLSEVTSTHSEVSYTDAIGIAQGYFEENSGLKCYFATDTDYKTHNNIELLDVGSEVNNITFTDVKYSYTGNSLVVTGYALSYETSLKANIGLYVNGSDEFITSGEFSLSAGTPAPFRLACKVDNFEQFKVQIENEDSLALDNKVFIYNKENEKSYKTLIVSDTPFFFQTVLDSVVNSTVDNVKTSEYKEDANSGYGLYIFDSFVPENLPKDGAVWLVNPTGSVENSGFSVQGRIDMDEIIPIMVSNSSSSLATSLKEGLNSDIYISSYAKCGLYRSFTTILEYKSNPILFAGTNSYGNREVVFAFSLHNSNLPLLGDFVYLIDNLVEYSFPDIIEEVSYSVGDMASVNVIANCDSIRVDSPSGAVSYLSTSGGVTQFKIDEVGTYDITVSISGSPRQFKIYGSLPEAECNPAPEAQDEFSLQGEASAGGLNGKYDPLLWLLICLVVIFAADWGVYCYEKYQLR